MYAPDLTLEHVFPVNKFHYFCVHMCLCMELSEAGMIVANHGVRNCADQFSGLSRLEHNRLIEQVRVCYTMHGTVSGDVYVCIVQHRPTFPRLVLLRSSMYMACIPRSFQNRILTWLHSLHAYIHTHFTFGMCISLHFSIRTCTHTMPAMHTHTRHLKHARCCTHSIRKYKHIPYVCYACMHACKYAHTRCMLVPCYTSAC
jgi:hypothetical protein